MTKHQYEGALVLVTIGVAIVIFVVVRTFAIRYLPASGYANYTAASAVVIFGLGFASSALLVNNTASGATDSGVPIQTAAPASVPHHVDLSAAAVQSLDPETSRAIGNIDILAEKPNTPGAGLTFPLNKVIYASGWVADSRSTAPASGVILIVDGSRRVNGTAFYGQSRPDLVRAFKNDSMLLAGFNNVPVPTDGLTPGSHQMQLCALDQDGKHFMPVGSPTQFTLK